MDLWSWLSGSGHSANLPPSKYRGKSSAYSGWGVCRFFMVDFRHPITKKGRPLTLFAKKATFRETKEGGRALIR
jgi:hypothetical protein